MYLTKNKQERCVMARVVRQRKLYQANFTLKQYGRWDKAMAAADKWIRGLLRNLPPPISRKGLMTARNRSGVVGVHRHSAVRERKGRPKRIYRSWVAWWPDCKLRGGVRWSVKKFGEDDAFVLAVLCRRMETHVRAKVLAALKQTRRTTGYNKILDLRRGKRTRPIPAVDAALRALIDPHNISEVLPD